MCMCVWFHLRDGTSLSFLQTSTFHIVTWNLSLCVCVFVSLRCHDKSHARCFPMAIDKAKEEVGKSIAWWRRKTWSSCNKPELRSRCSLYRLLGGRRVSSRCDRVEDWLTDPYYSLVRMSKQLEDDRLIVGATEWNPFESDYSYSNRSHRIHRHSHR